MPQPYRIGELAYVSGWSVHWGLHHAPAGLDEVTFRTGLPGELDAWMEAGELDAAPISSITYMRARDRYTLIPGLSISAWGRIGSATLFSEVPFQTLSGQTVAVPPHGGTSVELVRWLMERVFGVDATFVEATGTLADQLSAHPAVLLIGDAGLQAQQAPQGAHRLDLGQAWWQLTQTPFVTTVWACRSTLPVEERQRLADYFATGRRHSQAMTAAIAEAAAASLALPVGEVEAYLSLLNFELSPVHEQGLNLLVEQLGAPTHA